MGFEFKIMDTLADSSDLLGLYEILGWNDYLKLSLNEIEKSMNNSLFSVYVYDGDLLIGTGRVISDGVINAYICGIGVLPNYRNRGIGREITLKLSRYCLNQGLHVQLVCGKDLVPMYKKFGFDEFAIAMKMEENN